MKTDSPLCPVLLLMTDQQRFDTLGCMGNPLISTPHLDRLAAEGTLFRSAYTACPSCIPARAMLMTGMNQWRTGIVGMGEGQGQMGTNFPHTLPGELGQAGYYCKGIGKMHFYPQRSLNGFDHIELDESRRRLDPDFLCEYEVWLREQCGGEVEISPGRDWNGWEGAPYERDPRLHPNVWTAERSIRFLRDRDRSRPFFLKCSFARPHSPYDAIPEYYERYLQAELPEPVIGDWASVHDDPSQVDNPHAWHGHMPAEKVRQARAAYYGNVSHIDAEIGRILAELERQRLLDETLIIFTTDHGDMLGDHHMWRKTYAYEGSAHIPFLVRLPKRLQAGTRREDRHPVGLQDILPTVLETAGLPVPDEVDGRSLLPLMRGESVAWRDCLHGEHSSCYDSSEEMQYLCDGRVKYIWFPRTGREQLFALAEDPYERHDLSADPAWQTRRREWRRRLAAELAPRGVALTADERLPLRTASFVSPHYQRRLAGMSAAEKECFAQLKL